MHITCEGRSFDFFDGASPQNLWNIVRGERGRNDAVLADCDGDILDFQTPFPRDCSVRWIPLSSKQAYQAYRRTAIMLLVCGVKEIYGEKADIKVKHSWGNPFTANSRTVTRRSRKSCPFLKRKWGIL